MQRILVPLDGPELSEAALPAAEALARGHGAELILLRVIRVRLAPGAFRHAEAERYLSGVARELEGKGIRVRHATRVGPAPAVIQDHVRQRDIGLVAMSTHGRTGLTRFFCGSVAERVLRSAVVPVLLWRAPRSGDGENGCRARDKSENGGRESRSPEDCADSTPPPFSTPRW